MRYAVQILTVPVFMHHINVHDYSSLVVQFGQTCTFMLNCFIKKLLQYPWTNVFSCTVQCVVCCGLFIK